MVNPILYFKGKVLLSHRGIGMLFFIFMASFFFLLLIKESKGYTIIPCLLGYLIAVGTIIFYFGWQMCYFGISNKQLVVRNSIFFWWRRTILFTDIKSIRIDITTHSRPTRTYGPYYLRVFFDDLKTQKFYAGTLNARKWSLLAKELEKNDVRVINAVPYLHIPFRDML